jgi:hypothetical protein
MARETSHLRCHGGDCSQIANGKFHAFAFVAMMAFVNIWDL